MTAILRGQPVHTEIFLFFFFFFNFWLRWVFTAAHGLSLVAASGGYSSLRCTGFSQRWLFLLQSTGSRCEGSVVVAHRLQSTGSVAVARGLSSCGARAQLLRGMWDLPRPGLEPVSPELAGRFSTTAPPGKSQFTTFCLVFFLPCVSLTCLLTHSVCVSHIQPS